MPDEVQQGVSSYPGIPGFDSASYSVLHGKTPGRIVATTPFPPNGAPSFGTFTMTDGGRTLAIGGCKWQRSETQISEDGRLWTLTFLDRAWRWKFGRVSGHYNRRDDRGNLLPRTVKSPRQMMELLLKEMGETRWDIYAPDGLTEEQAGPTDDPAPGTRTPDTATNPEFEFDNHVPVDALLEVCDKFGLRLMRDPIRDIVVIRRPGDGAALPYTERFIDVSDGLEAFATPDGVGVAGGDALSQMRLKTVPVGKDWNGLWLPVDLLSYAPDHVPQPGRWTITVTPTATGPYTLVTTVGGVSFGAMVEDTATALAVRLTAAIRADPTLAPRTTAQVTDDGTGVVVIGYRPGDVVEIAAAIIGTNATAAVTATQFPTSSRWDLETPGQWRGVKAVPGRLSYEQARDLAVQTVGRCFRVADDDVSNGWGKVDDPKKIHVPLYGEIDHRDQLDLQAEKVEQVKPDAPDPNRAEEVGGADRVADQVDFYGGTSRGRSPTAYGSVNKTCQGRWFHADRRENTPAGSELSLPFAIDPAKQMMVFDQPLYRLLPVSTLPGGIVTQAVCRFPNLCLETAVKVRENKTYGRLRYLRWIEFGPRERGSENRDRSIEVDLSKFGIKGVKPFTRKLPRRKENIGTGDTPKGGIEWHPHPEAVYACIGRYAYDAATDRHTLVSARTDPDDVSEKVADHFLLGHMLEHQLEDAQTARYLGLELIPLDGAIMQLSWTIGRGGIVTTASRNQEHGLNVQPYPVRRRDENLAANAERAKLQATYYANTRGELDRLTAAGLSAAGLNR